MTTAIVVLYIVAFALFIYGLMGLTGPRTAVRGNLIAAVGMGIAVLATLLTPGLGNWALIVLGLGHDLSVFDKLLVVVAIAFGTINVVGGFLVTDRMLGMFKGKQR